ncbi:aquaporin [Sesbania bispinosa]|nr:aquaporin [Sesbania bispinosa]
MELIDNKGGKIQASGRKPMMRKFKGSRCGRDQFNPARSLGAAVIFNKDLGRY